MFFNIVEVLVVALMCCVGSVNYVHGLQAVRYQTTAYRNWLASNRRKLWIENVIWAIVGVALKWYLPMLLSLFVTGEVFRRNLANWLTLILFSVATGLIARRDYVAPAKKPFVVTLRVRRLAMVMLVMSIIVATVLSLLSVPPYFLFALMSYVVLLSALIINPYENRLNAGFYESARKKIEKRRDLITIGITGSYGKTNIKNILKELLSVKYNVLATPASFNTAMGISRVINDELMPEHQVFIAEMGANHVGEIRELAKLVRPRYGILTGIGQRHMDTFGSLANIAGTKYELIQGLPRNGVAVFGTGDDYIKRLFVKCEREKYRISLEETDDAYMKARMIRFGPMGTVFVMECENGEKVQCRTKLLGPSNIKNILMAAALAHKMGISMEQIAQTVRKLQPIEHRLQIEDTGEVVTIDNSCNEDLNGALEAVELMKYMTGTKIIVTPGLRMSDEKAETDANYTLGKHIANRMDRVIIIGGRPGVAELVKGLHAMNFIKEEIWLARDMEEAEELLHEKLENGDTILFEGRIPDYEDY